MSFTTAALLLTWLALLVLTLACAGLLRMVQDLREQIAAGPAGTTASGGAGVRGLALPASGPAAALRPEGGGVVLFVAPGCSACADVLDELSALPAQRVATSLVVACLGPCPASGLAARCVSDAHDLADLLQVPATPFALAVTPDGRVSDTHLPTGPGSTAEWFSQQEAIR